MTLSFLTDKLVLFQGFVFLYSGKFHQSFHRWATGFVCICLHWSLKPQTAARKVMLIALVAMVAINKVPHTEWFKKQRCIVLNFQRPDIQDQGIDRIGSFQGLRLPPRVWRLAGIFGVPPLVEASPLFLPSSSCDALLVCLSVYISLFHKDSSPIELGAHPSLAWPHWTLITSATPLFPSTVTFLLGTWYWVIEVGWGG